MFTVTLAVRVRPDRVEEFLAAITANAAASLHHEPGCLAFSVTRGGEGRFEVAERFRDRAAFDAHQERAGASGWRAATRHLQRNYRIEEVEP